MPNMPKGQYSRPVRAMALATEAPPVKRKYVRKKKPFVTDTTGVTDTGTVVVQTTADGLLNEIVTFGPTILNQLRQANMNACARMVEGWIVDANALQS